MRCLCSLGVRLPAVGSVFFRSPSFFVAPSLSCAHPHCAQSPVACGRCFAAFDFGRVVRRRPEMRCPRARAVRGGLVWGDRNLHRTCAEPKPCACPADNLRCGGGGDGYGTPPSTSLRSTPRSWGKPPASQVGSGGTTWRNVTAPLFHDRGPTTVKIGSDERAAGVPVQLRRPKTGL